MKKSVAILTKTFPQVSETFIVSNIIYAIRKGFKVRVFCDKFLGFSNSSQEQELQQYNIGEKVIPAVKPKQKTLAQIIQLSSFFLKPRNLYFTFKYRNYKSKGFLRSAFILKQFEQVSYNQVFHVHFNNSLESLLDATAIGYIHPRVIITFHGYDAFLETKESFQSKYSVFYKKYVKVVTVNSNYLKQAVLGLGVEEQLIRVIPIGFNAGIFSGTPKSINNNQQIEILTVGRLVPLKGVVYGLHTIKNLKEDGYKVHYTIIGEGEERANLEIAVKNLGIIDQVVFKGSCSQKEIKNAMEKAHIFLMPSTYDDMTGRREAFGLVSVEAQAMGLPVVGFKSGGFPDTIREGKTGYAVEDRNVKDLATKILYLIENPIQYHTVSNAAINHAANFDHSLTTQRYLNLYDEMD